ncbi:TolC family protein [Helicobacter mesocricetorum]|uniref:TolC family protein n=1 Tax=Helicobacter mesocricetorum TaxID=87012 RepID=UPI000CF16274|nr:TolC family protein [Helicobacter mesocricetorum]
MIYFALSISLAILCLGCAKLPNPQELTHKIPQSFSNEEILIHSSNTNLTASLTPKEQLNTLFLDESLSELYEIALQSNTDLQIMQTRIQQANAQLKSAWGGIFPTLNGNLNTANNHSRSNTSPVSKSSSQTTQIAATLSWEIDLFGRLNANKNAKESLYYQSLENLKNAEISLLANITSLYFTLRETTLNILLTEKNITALTQILELTRLKVENGLLDSTELFNKQDLLSNEQNTLQSLKMQLEETKNALLLLLDLNNLPFDIHNSFSFHNPQPLNPHMIPADVLLSRPDIQASIQSLYAQIYNKANAKASLFPILSFNANLNEILHSSTQNSGNIAWQLAASLSAPLLNRTQLTQNYFLQDALLKESYLTLQKNLNTAFIEIENAIFNTQNTQSQLENNTHRLQNAKEYYDFSNNRRITGLIDDLEYLNNVTLLNNSQKSFNSSKNAKLQALITLFKAFGGNLYLSKGMQ